MENKFRSDIDETIEYYEKKASVFIESTVNANVFELYEHFEKLLHPGCRILDLGCGSGRDSRYFVRQGYQVVALDPSPSMCKQTRFLVNIPVFEMKVEDMKFTDEFDGIWACASLLHVFRDMQVNVMYLMGKALKKNGICYCSWKYGDGDRTVEKRHFTDFTEKSFRELMKKAAMFQEEELWVTQDVRPDRQEQKWLNVIIRKINDV